MPAATRESAEEVREVQCTTCCVVGGGPGGMMLALLLARRGVPVTVLEAHPTFERDFRGDSIHSGILEILDEIGMAERLHELPHVKVYGPTLFFGQDSDLLFDLRDLLHTRFPYLMWMPQERFPAYHGRQRSALGHGRSQDLRSMLPLDRRLARGAVLADCWRRRPLFARA
jgi:hypothetical protein